MDVVALSKLLDEAKGGDDDVMDLRDAPATSKLTPADIAPDLEKKRLQPKAAPSAAADSKAIWDASEIPDEEDEHEAKKDARPRPEYDILYKQAVGTDAVFFGSDEKTPSSVDCEAIVVKIKFPGCRARDIELDVKRQKLVAESRTHKLSLYLPHPVREKEGRATFDVDTGTLSVSLPVIREGLFA